MKYILPDKLKYTKKEKKENKAFKPKLKQILKYFRKGVIVGFVVTIILFFGLLLQRYY